MLLNASARLCKAGIESAALDARLLMQEVLACSREELVLRFDEEMTAEPLQRFDALIRRRAAYEPVSHILGRREFYGREFYVTRDVLDPRADSETLVEGVLKGIGDWGLGIGSISPNPQSPIPNPRILDLGTGSGCLLITLLAELPGASGVAVDKSEAALAVAWDNARRHGVDARFETVCGNWLEGISGPFDIVISNPPYIPTAEIPALQPEVAQFEPKMALDGGKDGLDCYRELAMQVTAALAPEGFAALEIGMGQEPAVSEIFINAGWKKDAVLHDLAGIPRCLVFSRA